MDRPARRNFSKMSYIVQVLFGYEWRMKPTPKIQKHENQNSSGKLNYLLCPNDTSRNIEKLRFISTEGVSVNNTPQYRR